MSDELQILRNRVVALETKCASLERKANMEESRRLILERQMERMNASMERFIEDFEKMMALNRPIAPDKTEDL